MTATAKRYFLVGYLSLGGLATAACGSIFAFSTSNRAKEDAMVFAMTSGFSLVMILIAFTAMDRKFWRIVAVAGMALAVVAMLNMASYIAWERVLMGGMRGNDRDWQRWVVTNIFTTGLVCLSACLGALRMKFLGMVARAVTLAAWIGVYTVMLVMIWGDYNMERAFEDLAVFLWFVAVAGTLAVFALYRFFNLKLPDPVTAADQFLFVRCPRCMQEQDLPMGESRCKLCNLKFTIDFEEPRCPKCSYSLRALTGPVCPECGTAIIRAAGQEAGSPALAAAVIPGSGNGTPPPA